jgi:hypothetical protein
VQKLKYLGKTDFGTFLKLDTLNSHLKFIFKKPLGHVLSILGHFCNFGPLFKDICSSCLWFVGLSLQLDITLPKHQLQRTKFFEPICSFGQKLKYLGKTNLAHF